MKHHYLHGLLCITVIVLLLLTSGCSTALGGSRASYSESSAATSEKGWYSLSDAYEQAPSNAEEIVDTSPAKGEATALRKRIVTAEMNVRTRNYDALVSRLKEKMAELGGFLDYSSISGTGDDLRYSQFTFRIPSERLSEFVGCVGDLGTVLHYEESASDVTETYIDTQSRIAALEGERDALQEMLKESGSLADLLSIRNHLTDCIAELESYQARLRNLDAQIAYSTLRMTVSEVDREEATAPRDSFWGEVGAGISNSLQAIVLFLRSVAVAIMANIVYIALVVILIVILIILIRHKRKKKRLPPQTPSAN